MIFSALIKQVNVAVSGGKNEGDPVLRRGRIVLEIPDADSWQLDLFTELMHGMPVKFAVDEP